MSDNDKILPGFYWSRPLTPEEVRIVSSMEVTFCDVNAIKAERDRYRAALERIVGMNSRYVTSAYLDMEEARHIAREALKEAGND